LKTEYYKEYSHNLDREMEFKIYGHGGKLCFAFPPQNGRFFDMEDRGMIATLTPWLDSGKLQVVGVDGIDGESWTNPSWDKHARIEQHERWFRYVTEELYPRAMEINGMPQKALVTGCSMGAIHSGIFFFRRPDLFDGMIALSGLYSTDYFFQGYMDETVYYNSPVHFLWNMPLDHPYMELYRQSHIIACVGQGAWEIETLDGTRELERVLKEKGIPAWIDYWGFDVNHDWDWWQKQLPYFMGKVLESSCQS
jgi:esterase/lipase superfamily enzyme